MMPQEQVCAAAFRGPELGAGVEGCQHRCSRGIISAQEAQQVACASPCTVND